MSDRESREEGRSPLESAQRSRTTWLWLLSIITIILVGWVLHVTGTVFVPVVFSIFAAILVAPVDRWVARRVPSKLGWLGHLAAMGAILLVLVLFLGSIWIAAQQVVSRFPSAPGQIVSLLPQFGGGGRDESQASAGGTPLSQAAVDGSGSGSAVAGEAGTGGVLSQLPDIFANAGGSIGSTIIGWASGVAATIVSTAGSLAAATVLVFFLTLLMLIEAPQWREKISKVLRERAKQDVFESVGAMGERLRRYLLARIVLGIITAVLYVAWLWLFNLDLLIVWGLLAIILNFIPTLGSLISGILPVLYAFVQKDFGTAVMIGAGILAIEQVMGNFVDPRVQGKQVAVSPLVILIVLLLWGWIWGIAGAILAVPITIAMIIVFMHVPTLRPFALMLSSKDDLDDLDQIARPQQD